METLTIDKLKSTLVESYHGGRTYLEPAEGKKLFLVDRRHDLSLGHSVEKLIEVNCLMSCGGDPRDIFGWCRGAESTGLLLVCFADGTNKVLYDNDKFVMQ